MINQIDLKKIEKNPRNYSVRSLLKKKIHPGLIDKIGVYSAGCKPLVEVGYKFELTECSPPSKVVILSGEKQRLSVLSPISKKIWIEASVVTNSE